MASIDVVRDPAELAEGTLPGSLLSQDVLLEHITPLGKGTTFILIIWFGLIRGCKQSVRSQTNEATWLVS